MSGSIIRIRGKLELGRRPAPANATGEPTPPPPTPLARRLALAHHIEALVEEGIVESYSHAARQLGITPARLTQVLNLMALSPTIQEEILLRTVMVTERELRPILRESLWVDQRLATPAVPETGADDVASLRAPDADRRDA